MGKQNNNFEYFKPQSGNLLIPSDSDSDDCKDSDSKAMFALPKRKFIRAKGSKSKGRQCCRELCGAVAPLVIAVFIIATLVSIGYIVLGVNGMRREIELLKIQLNKVKSDEQSDLLESKGLQSEVKRKLGLVSKDEKEIAELKTKIKSLSSQVKYLNATILQVKEKHDSAGASKSVDQDIKLLQKGMADTGGEIKKLSDESEGTKKTITLLSKIIKAMKKDVTKLSKTISTWDGGPLPTEVPDTVAPLTTSPGNKEESEKASVRKITKLIKNIINGYSELFKNKTKQLSLELTSMKTEMRNFNNTCKIRFVSVEHDVAVLTNITNKHKEQISAVNAELKSGPTMTKNASSEGKVLKIVKDIIIDLKKHQIMINNLTRRMVEVEKQSHEKENAKGDETVVDVTQIPITTEPTTVELTTTGSKPTTESLNSTESPKEALLTPVTTMAPTTTLHLNGTSSKSNQSISEQLGLSNQPSTKAEPVKAMSPETTEIPRSLVQSATTNIPKHRGTSIGETTPDNSSNIANIPNVNLTVPESSTLPKSVTEPSVITEPEIERLNTTIMAAVVGEHSPTTTPLVSKEMAHEEPKLNTLKPDFDETREEPIGKESTKGKKRKKFMQMEDEDFRPQAGERLSRHDEMTDDAFLSEPPDETNGLESSNGDGKMDALDSLDDAA